MKKLFAIRTPKGKLLRDKDKNIRYFGNKEQAKCRRDEANEVRPGHTVTAGPDHT